MGIVPTNVLLDFNNYLVMSIHNIIYMYQILKSNRTLGRNNPHYGSLV